LSAKAGAGVIARSPHQQDKVRSWSHRRSCSNLSTARRKQRRPASAGAARADARRGIVEAHGGIVKVDSYPKKGTIFTIDLPVDASTGTADL
jgi:hypothetical protein